MRGPSDRDKRLQGALDAIDDALFGASPKDKFDVDRNAFEARASDLKALSQRIQQLDEYYSRAVAEISGHFFERHAQELARSTSPWQRLSFRRRLDPAEGAELEMLHPPGGG
jgi:hypothetical protein